MPLVAVTELIWVAVITSGLAFAGTLLVAALANWNRRTSREVAAEILEHLDTGNGHTAGQSLHRIEDVSISTILRVDAVEAQIREQRGKVDEITASLDAHIEDTATRAGRVAELQASLDGHIEDVSPLVDWIKHQMEEG